MSFPNIDNKLVGLIVAFDAETGDVLHIHQKFVETVDGRAGYSEDVTPDEHEEIRADTARCHPRRRVDVIVAPPELGPREGEAFLRYHVDPMTRRLRKEAACDPCLEAGPRVMRPLR